MIASLLDEGAGDIDSRAFQERMEEKAIQLGFTAARDQFRGSLRTLSVNLDEAVDLLRLALTAPRFDAEPVERIRDQLLAQLVPRHRPTRTRSPTGAGGRRRFRTIPMAQPCNGTPESIAAITVDDLKAYVRNVFARDTLTVGIVGDIDRRCGRQADRPRVRRRCPRRRRLRRFREPRCRASASASWSISTCRRP